MKASCVKRRITLCTLIIACSVTFGTPHARAQSWGDNPSSQIFKSALEEMTKIIDEIQKAVVLVVLIQSVTTQINQIIESAGGAIVGTAGWLAYFHEVDEAARVKTRNELSILTRGGTTGFKQSVGDAGDSIQGRIRKFAESSFSEKKEQQVSSGDFLRNGDIGTVNNLTGKSELNNIASFTATLNPQNSFMISQIGADKFAEARKEELRAREFKQIGAGFNSARPGQTAATVYNTEQEAIGSILRNNNLSPTTKSILGVSLNRLLKDLGGKAEDAVGKKIKSAKNDLKETFNKIGGSKEFEKSY